MANVNLDQMIVGDFEFRADMDDDGDFVTGNAQVVHGTGNELHLD